jgi:AcrR family transcriptional regulator
MVKPTHMQAFPVPRRRRLSAAARRQTILDAATPIFVSAGYEQARMATIADRVGVTEPVIFQNFGSKPGLFAAVLDEAAGLVSEHVRALSEQFDDAVEWLGHLLNAEHLDRLHTSPMFGVLFADAHRLRTEAGVAAALLRAVNRFADAAADVLAGAQAKGTIREDVPPTTLAWLVVSLVQARQFRREHTTDLSTALEGELLAAILTVLRPRI